MVVDRGNEEFSGGGGGWSVGWPPGCYDDEMTSWQWLMNTEEK